MPVVYQANTRHEPDAVVKHDWGIIMITGNEKTSLPWHTVKSVREVIDE